MVATGELIRLMNYVDDIATTLRRMNGSLDGLTEEERRRLAEYMKKAEPAYASILHRLEGGK